MDNIPVVNFNQLIRQYNESYKRDFELVFTFGANSTIICRNTDIAKFNTFFNDNEALFRTHEILINQLVLVPAGQGEIEVVHLNKKKLQKAYGMAFVVYIKVCRYLNLVPNDRYTDCVIIKIE
ncbi:hypothetical protein SAMD00019534_013990, partial [Acytostelium subglobosum LB1]|uniref:hypothetical protein n=1 Tax=Acytostelium subglobosum LB1 TaxID=1410327 RepID=UPI000644EEEC